MVKVVLMSVLFATVAIPALAARDPVPRRGLKRAVVLLVAFDVLYVAVLLLVYVPFLVPELW
jgi:hypothetical protein